MKPWLLAMITSVALGHTAHGALADGAPKTIRPTPTQLQHGARFVPAVAGDPKRMIGIKVYAIQDGSRPARSGLNNGDLILAVDGVAATTADDARIQERTQEIVAMITEPTRHKLEVRRKDAVIELTVPER
ncbi:MAG: PDZ domain-containing protein [Kofleriaceae bacterium]